MVSDWTDEARKRCEAATRGPWTAEGDESLKPWAQNHRFRIITQAARDARADGPNPQSSARLPYAAMVMKAEHDATFIAHARTDLPRALAEIERLRGLVEDWRRWLWITEDSHSEYPGIERAVAEMDDLIAALEADDGHR